MQLQKSTRAWWIVIGMGYGIISFLVGLLLFPLFSFWSLLGSVIVFFALSITTIIWGWQIVPEMEEWRIQILGQDTTPWQPGLHVLIPFIARIYAAFYTGTQSLQLYMDEKIKSGMGAGDVDFKDGTAKVIAIVYFRFKDTYKAAYNVSDAYNAIGDKVDGGLRAYLANKTIDEATRTKVHDVKHDILNLAPSGQSEDTQKLYEQFEAWGIEIHSIAITDIILDERVQEARHLTLKAQREAEAQKIKADAEREMLRLQGVGRLQEALAIAGLQDMFTWDDKKKELSIKSGTPLDQSALERARRFIAELQLYQNIGDKTVFFDSKGSNWPAIGALFGAGQNIQNNQNQEQKGGKQ